MDTEKAFLLNQRFVLLDNEEKRIGFDSVSNLKITTDAINFVLKV